MTAADQKLAERVLKGIYKDYDWSGTRIYPLQQAFGERAVQAALCADFLEQKGIWVVVTTNGIEYYQEHLKPKPRVSRKPMPRDMDYEEALIRATVACELLEKFPQGRTSLAVRGAIKSVVGQQLRQFWEMSAPERYHEEHSAMMERLGKII